MKKKTAYRLRPLLALPLSALLVLSGCGVYIENQGVRVKGLGIDIEASEDGASVRLPGIDVDADGGGASIHIPGISLEAGDNGANVDIGGKNMPKVDIAVDGDERVDIDVWGEDGQSYSLASGFFDRERGAVSADRVVLPVFQKGKSVEFSWAKARRADRYTYEIQDLETGELLHSQKTDALSGKLPARYTEKNLSCRLTIIALDAERAEISRYTTFFHVGDIVVDIHENVDDGCVLFDPTRIDGVATGGKFIRAQRGGLHVEAEE